MLIAAWKAQLRPRQGPPKQALISKFERRANTSRATARAEFAGPLARCAFVPTPINSAKPMLAFFAIRKRPERISPESQERIQKQSIARPSHRVDLDPTQTQPRSSPERLG